jgi:hypothetical protein
MCWHRKHLTWYHLIWSQQAKEKVHLIRRTQEKQNVAAEFTPSKLTTYKFWWTTYLHGFLYIAEMIHKLIINCTENKKCEWNLHRTAAIYSSILMAKIILWLLSRESLNIWQILATLHCTS